MAKEYAIRTTIYLTEKMHADINELARRKNSDMAKMIRLGVEQLLAKNTRKPRQ